VQRSSRAVPSSTGARLGVLAVGVGLIVGTIACSSSSGSGAAAETTGLATAGQFCQLSATARDAGLAIDISATDPATVEPQVQAVIDASKAVAAAAPADYADIASKTVAEQEQLLALWAKYDYDFAKMQASNEGKAFFADPDFAALQTGRDTYLQKNCDVAPAQNTSADAGVILSPGDEGIRQMFQILQIGGQLAVTDEQIDCLVDALSGQISDADLNAVGSGGSVSDAGTAALVAAISTCGVVPAG
jgi:hypothetical protein